MARRETAANRRSEKDIEEGDRLQTRAEQSERIGKV
jgi:hypothetical protein